MDFKIDTTETYTIIAPANDTIDASLAAGINEQCHQLTENGSNCFIIDLTACNNAGQGAEDLLLQLHEQCYARHQSLVFIGVSESLMQLLKLAEVNLTINVAPTLEEAADIINMEILERELNLDGEEDPKEEDFF